MAEWFRKNAGIVVFNRDKRVLVCQRIDMPDSWQFPQGGIEEDETPLEAARRELKEETSLTDVVHLKTLDEPARYYFPPEVIARMKKRGYTNSGQDVFWSLFYFDGPDKLINLQTAEPEFKAFRWVTLDKSYSLAVDFKKPVYATAIKAFASLIVGHNP